MTASVEPQPKDVRPELREAKYERFNFHRVDHLAQLQEILCSQAKHSPRVVLLSGERGIGRRFCLEAAVHLAAQTGEKIALLIFALDGYEPDSVSLETFVNEQLVKVQQQSHEKRSQLLQNRKITRSLYHTQDKLTEAESYYQRALAIEEQTLGPNHPDTAATLHALGNLYHDQDKLTDAEPLIRRALAIIERVFGPDHPHVATVLEDLAVLLEKAGRSEEATAATQSAEAIRKKQS